jgi:hypothetical protein
MTKESVKVSLPPRSQATVVFFSASDESVGTATLLNDTSLPQEMTTDDTVDYERYEVTIGPLPGYTGSIQKYGSS